MQTLEAEVAAYGTQRKLTNETDSTCTLNNLVETSA